MGQDSDSESPASDSMVATGPLPPLENDTEVGVAAGEYEPSLLRCNVESTGTHEPSCCTCYTDAEIDVVSVPSGFATVVDVSVVSVGTGTAKPVVSARKIAAASGLTVAARADEGRSNAANETASITLATMATIDLPGSAK